MCVEVINGKPPSKISFVTLTYDGETDQLEKLNLELREQGYEVMYDLGGEIYDIRVL